MENTNDRFAALRYSDFRLLWIGQLISNVGSQMQLVALNWHIYILTHSAFALGMIGLTRFVPIVIFSLIGGNFADSHNRKTIMLYTQSALTLFSLLLAFYTFSGSINAFLIYALSIASSIALAFDMPARQALIPNLIDRKHLANAMSLNTIMFQVSTLAGPTLAGFMIAKLGVGSIYAANGVSFIAVILALLLIKTSGAIQGAASASPMSLTAVLDGIRFVKSHTIVWSTMLLDFFSTFFSAANTLLPVFATEVLHVGPEGLGILYAAPSLGALIAGYTIAHIGQLRNQGKILLVAVFLYGLFSLLFGISKLFTVSLLFFALTGAGDSVSTIIRNVIRQVVTPDHLRGRMTAINMIFFMGGPQLGEFESGVLASLIGAPLAVVVGGVGTMIIVTIMAFKIPALRRYDTHEHITP